MQVEGQTPHDHQTQFLVMEAFPPNVEKEREREYYTIIKLFFGFLRISYLFTFLSFAFLLFGHF